MASGAFDALGSVGSACGLSGLSNTRFSVVPNKLVTRVLSKSLSCIVIPFTGEFPSSHPAGSKPCRVSGVRYSQMRGSAIGRKSYPYNLVILLGYGRTIPGGFLSGLSRKCVRIAHLGGSEKIYDQPDFCKQVRVGVNWALLKSISESVGGRSPFHDESRARQTSRRPQHPGAEFFARFLARPLSRLCLHVLASQNQKVTA